MYRASIELLYCTSNVACVWCSVFCWLQGLNIDPQRPLGPSLLSHCLIDYAGRISADVQRDLVELIFEGNLALGELLSDVDFLLRMAERVGACKDCLFCITLPCTVQFESLEIVVGVLPTSL